MAPAGADPRSAAHGLLLALAGTLTPSPSLRHDPVGRPQVPGLAVSVSYTRHLIAVAASPAGPLGVDVEEVYPREIRGLADRWFDPAERDWMAAQPDELRAFLHLWTAKEAVGKALGTGLRNAGLRRRMPLGGGTVESAPGLVVTHVPWEGVVLAIAARAVLTQVVVTAHDETASWSDVMSRTDSPVVVPAS